MKLKSDKKEFIGNQKSTKVDQRLTKQNLTKGAYFYYVDKILDFGKYPKVFFQAKYNLLEICQKRCLNCRM